MVSCGIEREERLDRRTLEAKLDWVEFYRHGEYARFMCVRAVGEIV